MPEDVLTDPQRRALKRIRPVLQGVLEMYANSYTNLIGPDAGRITDPKVLRECRAIEAFCNAFGLKHTPTKELCADELHELNGPR